MAEPPVRACARPITLIHQPKAGCAVLCIHGYAGYPGELALPARHLFEAGFDVVVPRLPGHGTSGVDFMRSRKDDWVGVAEETLIDLNGQYREVSLVGHSMGGAIAVLLASRHPVASVVLYAPALHIPALNHSLISLLSLFVRRKRVAWSADPRFTFFDERDADDDAYLGAEYWSWLYFTQLRDLSMISRKARKALSSISTDILVLTGELDTTVGTDVGPMVVELGGGRNNWVHLEKATHLIPYDIDEDTREEAMSRTVEWLCGAI